MSLVGLESMCQSRSYGGLGMRQLRDQNTFFLMKIGYNIMDNNDTLWVCVLRSKYRINESISENIVLELCCWQPKIEVFLNINGIVSLGFGLAATKGVVRNEMGTEFSGTIAIWGSVQLLTLNYGAFWMDSTSTISNSALIRRIQYLLTEEAKEAFGRKEDLQTLDSPLREIQEILDMDRIKNCVFQ
ncbi:hypothetical protein Godav_014109 [Gossypium davidsonii]|uniref:Uncharacterized protein n=1 Tax=Gossypium davidsonii TaxID=34287 RepID=A0A7J8RK39_GOSDV|nr:hypothetical protein [Gossypium davidsonii]